MKQACTRPALGACEVLCISRLGWRAQDAEGAGRLHKPVHERGP